MLDVHAVVSVRGDDKGSRVYIYLKKCTYCVAHISDELFSTDFSDSLISIVKPAKVITIIRL